MVAREKESAWQRLQHSSWHGLCGMPIGTEGPVAPAGLDQLYSAKRARHRMARLPVRGGLRADGCGQTAMLGMDANARRGGAEGERK
jgi:hypothetical protein